MEKLYLINEAAKLAETTAETLRYYDRLNLVKSIKGKNGYRYYKEEQILILINIKKLQLLGFSLNEIREILFTEDLKDLNKYLDLAIKKCDEEIKRLKDTKKIILRAKSQYQKESKNYDNIGLIEYNDRYVLLSQYLKEDELTSLYNYQKNFKDEINSDISNYEFIDQAGIYLNKTKKSMFIECIKYNTNNSQVNHLKKGNYLVLSANKEDKEKAINNLKNLYYQKHHKEPKEIIILIKVTGILSWKYQIEILDE